MKPCVRLILGLAFERALLILLGLATVALAGCYGRALPFNQPSHTQQAVAKFAYVTNYGSNSVSAYTITGANPTGVAVAK